MAERMTGEEYQEKLIAIMHAARMLVFAEVDIDDLLARIERADSFGAMLDPTLYRANHGKMMEDKALLEAARPLWRYAKKLYQDALARAAQDDAKKAEG